MAARPPSRRPTDAQIRWLESGVIPSLIDCNRTWWDEDDAPNRGPRAFRTAGYLACPLNDP